MTIIYNLADRKLNNDLREYLTINNYRWEYFKDYQEYKRIVILCEPTEFKISEFEQFRFNKRKIAYCDFTIYK